MCKNPLVTVKEVSYLFGHKKLSPQTFRTISFITKKYDPAREELSLGVTWAQECGLTTKWSEQDLPARAFLDPKLPLVHNNAKMSLEHLLLPLLFYGTILAISLLEFVREMIGHFGRCMFFFRKSMLELHIIIKDKTLNKTIFF